MRYADSVSQFIKAYLRNALVAQTPHMVWTAWLNRQTILAQEGVDFNEDKVLAIDVHKVYRKVEQQMLADGEIVRIYINYGDVVITLYGPKGTTVRIKASGI